VITRFGAQSVQSPAMSVYNPPTGPSEAPPASE